MDSLRRRWTLGFVVAIGAVWLAGVSAQPADPAIGTWKLNVEKSKYSPGTPPKSQTLKIEQAGQGVKVTTDGVNARGEKTATEYTASYDGKDYPITGSPAADHVSLKRIDARTTERTDKKDGKVVQTVKRVVSQDGKTMTVTTKGMNPQGQTINNTAIYEKQ